MENKQDKERTMDLLCKSDNLIILEAEQSIIGSKPIVEVSYTQLWEHFRLWEKTNRVTAWIKAKYIPKPVLPKRN